MTSTPLSPRHIPRAHLHSHERAFTLVELLVVMMIILALLGLTTPMIRGVLAGRNIGDGANTVADYLAYARTQAMTQNTYTLVGFAQNSDELQIGSAIATGTFDPTKISGSSANYPALGKVVTVSNVRLVDAGHLDSALSAKLANLQAKPDANGDTVVDCVAQASDSRVAFKSGTRTFGQSVIAFSPQGEALIFPQSSKALQNFSATLPFYSQLFIGMRASRGGAAVTNDQNSAALTIDGGTGSIKTYRP